MLQIFQLQESTRVIASFFPEIFAKKMRLKDSPTRQTHPTAVVSHENPYPRKGNGGEYQGSMDDVRIWNRTCSTAEIDRDKGIRLIGNEHGLGTCLA